MHQKLIEIWFYLFKIWPKIRGFNWDFTKYCRKYFWKIKKETIFKKIAKTYFKYKQILQLIKELVVYKQFVENEKRKSKVTDPKNSPDNSTENIKWYFK